MEAKKIDQLNRRVTAQGLRHGIYVASTGSTKRLAQMRASIEKSSQIQREQVLRQLRSAS